MESFQNQLKNRKFQLLSDITDAVERQPFIERINLIKTLFSVNEETLEKTIEAIKHYLTNHTNQEVFEILFYYTKIRFNTKKFLCSILSSLFQNPVLTNDFIQAIEITQENIYNEYNSLSKTIDLLLSSDNSQTLIYKS